MKLIEPMTDALATGAAASGSEGADEDGGAKPARDATPAVAIDCEFMQPPEKVWRLLTEPTLMADWLLPGAGAATVDTIGQRFSLEHAADPAAQIHCEVLELEPNRLLSYRWRHHSAVQSEPDVDSVVTFVLTPRIDGGTHLRLVHSGLPQPVMMSLMPLCTSRREAKCLAHHSLEDLRWAA